MGSESWTVESEHPAGIPATPEWPNPRPPLGAQILRDLGVHSIRLRTSTPRTYVGLTGFGIEIKSYEPPF